MNLLLWAALSACIPNIPRGTAAADVARAAPRQVLQPDPSSPNVYLSATVMAGSAWDRPGEEGIAALTARAMVEGGAGDRGPEEVADALYRTGNGVEVVVGKDLLTFRLRCHRDQVELCVELFGDVLARPRFDPAVVRRLADEATWALSDGAADDEEALAWQVLDAWVFEGQPYGHAALGRHGVLGLLDAEDLRAWWSTHGVRGATVIGLAGAYPPEAVGRLEARLEGLGRTLPPGVALMGPRPPEGRELLYVDTGSDVVGFRVGHPTAITRDHPDYPAMVLAMTAFGAHRQSFGILFRTLRATRGLNYGTYAYIEPFEERSDAALAEQGIGRRQGLFHLWIRPTSIENGPFALKLALDAMERLVRDGLTPEQVTDTQAYLRGAIPLLAQDPGRRLAYAVEAAALGLPDPLLDLPARIAALTPDEVNAAIRRHLHPADVRIVAVGGQPDAVIARLLAGETPIAYAPGITPDADQAARDAEVAARPLGLLRERVRVIPAAEVLR